MLVFVASCGLFGGDDEKSITIAIDQDVLSVQQGSRDSVIVTLTRANFDGPVELSVEGTLPAGVTTTFSPRTIPAGSTTSKVRFIATGAAAPGSFIATLRATAEGVADKAVEIDVSVNLTGSFTLGTLSGVTIAQGGGGDATILLNRSGGNASSVSLDVTGMPSGMTATIAQSPTTERGVSLGVAASAGVAPGSYTLTVTGTAAGITTNPTTQLAVTVIAPPSTASVSVPFCSGAIPVWFAYQNEGFAWQRISPTGTSFNFAATQKVAIAYVQLFGAESQATLFFATRAELASLSDRDCSGTKTLTGTVNGLTAGQTALVVMGASDTTTTSGNYTLQSVANRPLDLVSTRGVLSFEGFLSPDKMIVRRALDLTSTIPTLDFTTAEAFTPETSNLAVSNFASGFVVEYQNNLWTSTSTYGTVSSGSLTGGSGTFSWTPPAQLAGSDLHELFIDSYQANGQVGNAVVTYFTTTGDRNEALGPLLSTPTVAVAAASPYARMRGQLPAQAEYASAARFVFLQGTTGNRKFVLLVGTAGYFGSPSTWDLVTPDLSAVTGFENSWMLANGQSTPFSAEAFSGRSEVLFGALPVPGDVITLAFRVSFASTLLRAPSAGGQPRRTPLLTQYFRR